MMRRFCFTLDLKNDPALIAEYKKHHEKVWPEIAETYRQCGIESMELYLLETRMFMIMEVSERFTFEAKAHADRTNPRLQEWEHLMERFQQVPAGCHDGEKWKRMERIFTLQNA